MEMQCFHHNLNQNLENQHYSNISNSHTITQRHRVHNENSSLYSNRPTSLKITFRQIKNGAELDFEDCMRMEYRMVSKVMSDHDFYEGVRALIIDKDNKPLWKPGNIDEISDETIDEFFKNLENNELNFNTR